VKIYDSNPELRLDLPILAQSLPAVLLEDLSAVFMAEWRTVLGKRSCCEEECKPIIIRDIDKALYLLLPGTIY